MTITRRLSWLWRRLRVMSPGEIAHRLRVALDDGLERIREQLQATGGSAPPEALLAVQFFNAREPQLFLPPCEPDPDADRHLLAGELPVFGQWIPVDPAVGFWHTDPLTKVVWPRVPYRSIDYRPGNATGDVRVVWEPNRLQHLFRLALIAHEQPDQRVAAVALLERDLGAWSAANPPGLGVNYLSAMEEALRLISLFHAFDLVRTAVSPGTRSVVAAIAAHHARHVQRRLSLYSSSGNHTIAEATGLLYAGVLLPEWPGAARWRATGRRLLAAEAMRQIDADGGGIEQATWYLLFITDLLGLAQALLAHAGEPAEPAIDAALTRSRNFLNALATSPADLPRIGDGDDGYALSATLRLSWKPGGRGTLQRTFSRAGLSLVRFAPAEREIQDRLLFLHNPLGMAPGFGHGHGDCLSVLFRWAGADLLIDPGTYGYADTTGLRQYFRSATGHNTATVNRADQAEQTGPFLWSRPFTATLLSSRFEADGTWLLARHDAFKDQGVEHRRGVVYRRDRYLAVWDRFDGGAGKDVTLHWHLGCSLAGHRDAPAGRVELESGGRRLLLEVSGGSLSIASGIDSPPLGWRSPHYGSIEPATTLEVRASDAPVPRVVTVLWLGKPGSLASLEAEFQAFDTFSAPVQRPVP